MAQVSATYATSLAFFCKKNWPKHIYWSNITWHCWKLAVQGTFNLIKAPLWISRIINQANEMAISFWPKWNDHFILTEMKWKPFNFRQNEMVISFRPKWNAIFFIVLRNMRPEPALVLQWTLPWPYNTPDMALYIMAIFFNVMQQKWDQGPLGTQRSTPIGSRTCLGTSMDPAMALQYTKHGPLYFGPLRVQGGSWTLWGSAFVSPESLDPIFVA